jgi:hypothetical protein
MLTYNQVFALYLIDIADILQQDEFVEALAFQGEVINKEFDMLQLYKIISAFIELYRGCFLEKLNLQMKKAAAEGDLDPQAYANPANIPLVANDFNVGYIPPKMNFLTRQTALDLSAHLCSWLVNRGLTNFQVSPNSIQ